ncbi:morphogenetic protein [Edwardsiella piscicida]|uniref:morphogenetic protein n=1 Tax=Edwardsiella piscicida TaxID=1263550 RepID=UPI00084C635C|nr:morphogenetic protein [Edwardsiella piscicida]AOP43740.1 morphogenetic protein [Edwardsiella piscicida]EKS7766575.1 morphogenetic protein [Edwardsiella piscicida]UCQ30342.1 morphogenetic protein [Edwardsiella piscicida]UCQ56667.1 morphogenetic protein [Edwardsiella piscicida]
MKDLPIIFNDEMVRAILSGTKTMTRRPVKDRCLELFEVAASVGECHSLQFCDIADERSQPYYREFCPFGAVGDRLWVREAYQGSLFDYEQMEAYLEDNSKFEKQEYCEYRADGGSRPEYYDGDDNLRHGWRPSIHMPRWASRITLEITDVRVERLQDITEGDARSEGVTLSNPRILSHRDEFRQLWGDIYGCDGWRSNPWVWVIAFKRVDTGSAAGTSKGE